MCNLHDRIALKHIDSCLRRHLSSSQSASQILADAITGFLPAWLRRQAVNLPTKSSKLIRTQASLATREGRRAINEKIEAARQGLDPSDDVYSLLCQRIPRLCIH